ncbi:unnamed protein product [Phyllotreta striolata]|uniref:Fatty acyl-CoA reductase n=1 Tax=Phyllotreta striolata TaxID=444603 RepID=A0A9N9XQ02_PHYSR|nr:unnamed protein product [Phyllotreta striolata]
MDEDSPMQKFYKGANVFVTGGTGFMGKILIEKLLRSTQVDAIYVLIREKKGKNAHARIDELFDNVVFDRLKKETPKFRHRVEPVAGDCSLSGLGLSIDDRQTLASKIDVVFHAAATVRFDEHIKVAYDVNVNAAKEVVHLARQMKRLKSFVHVSTAYSNCPRAEIDEKIYDFPAPYQDVEALLEKVDELDAERLTSRIIGQWPNTYTFTKALAESLVKDIGNGLPVAIFRPSIVVSTYKDPIEGWIDNLYGPTGVCAAVLSGVMRVFYCHQEKLADLVPVDLCVDCLIATAWDVSTDKREHHQSSEMPVYNYVSSPENPITWREMINLNYIQGKKYPAANSLWETFLILTDNFYVYWILSLFLHTLPGLLVDCFALLTGNKPRMSRIYKKIHKFSMILSYFASRSWTFSNGNVRNLWEKLDERDKRMFPFSATTLHWLMFFRGYIRGLRVHLLNENDDTLEIARAKQKRFYVISRVIKYALLFAACNVLATIVFGCFY